MPDHQLLGHAQLVGLGLLIFAKPEHAHHAKVDFASAGTGPLGLGNKGALVAHVEIYGCWLSLVCCHLAAGSKGPSRRNAEYWSVEERLNLTGVPGQLVVWCGDLNYRIALEADEVRRHAIAGEHGPLLEADELRHAQATGAAFVGFHEGERTFAPTYKYDVGTSTFDSSKKARAPAWCDRVLWRSDASVEVRSLSYASHELKTSDHRPVSALLHVTLLSAKKAVRPEQRQRGILSTLLSVCCLGGFNAKGYHVLLDANLSKRAVADTAASSAPHEQPPEQTLLSPEGTDRVPLLEPREGHARGKPRKKASGRHSKGEAGPPQNSMGSR
jgi:endonuclease/exonuclease/phosphatase family metal-dependent hydrolase